MIGATMLGALIACSTGGSMAGDAGAGPRPAGRTIALLPLGDSITRGDPTEDGYRGFLRDELAARGVAVRFLGTQRSRAGAHEGWTGITTEELLGKLAAALAAEPPELVLLHIGTNDLGLGVDPDRAARSVGAIVDQLQAAAARPGRRSPRILVAQIIPRNLGGDRPDELVLRFNRRVGELAAERRKAGKPVALVDMHKVVDARSDLGDALHPNPGGYRKIARAWAEAIVAGGS